MAAMYPGLAQSPQTNGVSDSNTKETTTPPSIIDPALSLELRLRWLEAILLGVRQDAKDSRGKDKVVELKNGDTLLRVAEDIQRRLDAVVDSNDGLKRFMDSCEPHVLCSRISGLLDSFQVCKTITMHSS